MSVINEAGSFNVGSFNSYRDVNPEFSVEDYTELLDLNRRRIVEAKEKQAQLESQLGQQTLELVPGVGLEIISSNTEEGIDS